MNSSSSSNRVPPAIHGYQYDPVLNRFFKCPGPGSNTQLPTGDAAKSGHTLHHQDGGPPSYRFRVKPTVISRKPEYNPEIDPPSISKQRRYNARTPYQAVCSQPPESSHLSLSNDEDKEGEITNMAILQRVVGYSQPVLLIGTSYDRGFMIKLEDMFGRPESVRWAPVDLSDTGFADVAPVTSIACTPDVACFGSAAGCDVVQMYIEYDGYPCFGDGFTYNFTTWCLRLISQKLLMGTEECLRIADLTHETLVYKYPNTCILDIEGRSEFNSLLGTRSGHLLQYDMRTALHANKRKIAGAGSIFKLKMIDDNQVLIVGALSHAKVHDLRYLTSKPIICLDDWQNSGDHTIGLTTSNDNSLVCMAGRDQSIRIWDLKSNPNPGLGLRPIVTHSTSQPVKSVLFVDDDFSPENVLPIHTDNEDPPGIYVAPLGTGILFNQGNEFHWLGRSTASVS